MIDKLLKDMKWKTPFGRTDWREIQVDLLFIAMIIGIIYIAIKYG